MRVSKKHNCLNENKVDKGKKSQKEYQSLNVNYRKIMSSDGYTTLRPLVFSSFSKYKMLVGKRIKRY